MSARSKIFSIKAAGVSSAATDEQLAKINAYAMSPLTADQVYVRKFLMAHTNIDRDNECFPPEMIDQFSATMPGKSLLIGHERRGLPCGKFFDAATEEMTPDRFKALTGEDPRLPTGAVGCKVLWTWAYLVKTPGNDELISQIDGGVCSHCSIGFKAADCTAVKTDVNGPVQYWQYVGPGEALEGSLVWLGAQPGAAAYKQAGKPDNHEEKGVPSMKEFLASLGTALGLTKALEESTAVAAIKAAFEEQVALVAKLSAEATDGRAYRAALIADAVKYGQLIGEVPDDEKAKAEEEAFYKTLPIDRLKGMRDKYETAARTKFPTHAVFVGKDESDRRATEKAAGEKAAATGRKDYSNPAHNELFKTVG